MKTIKKSIEISAPRENVWAVLLDDTYTRDWYAAFGNGLHAESDWIVGHRIVFKDHKNSGLSGIISVKNPYEELSFVFDSLIKNGKPDMESDMAKSFAGSKESYFLTGQNGTTTLKVEFDCDEQHYDKMSSQWDQALDRIAELANSF
jgi:uncharacterized protein YndB with AHSA1/START domain